MDKEHAINESDNLEHKVIGDLSKFTETDTDSGMRVAEKCRMYGVRRRIWSKEDNDGRNKDEDLKVEGIRYKEQLVRTFEKGEIVISMDGELLLVNKCRQDSNIDSDDAKSLGSIEEPDVLDCWEAETIESFNKTKIPTNHDLASNFKNIKNVQLYYRIQDDSSITSTEEEYVAPRSCLVIEENPVSVDQTDDKRIPIDEAFEVRESCYIDDKSLPNNFSLLSITDHNASNQEGIIPSRAVGCNIQ